MRKQNIRILIAIIMLSTSALAQNGAKPVESKPAAAAEPRVLRLSPDQQKEFLIKAQQVELESTKLQRAQGELREFILNARPAASKVDSKKQDPQRPAREN
jgi:hypothetical protein